MFKVNDRVKSSSYGVGTIVMVGKEKQFYIIEFDEYNSSLESGEEFYYEGLETYVDCFYGVFTENEIKVHDIVLYTIQDEINDINKEIRRLIDKKESLYNKLKESI